MPIELQKEDRKQVVASIQRYFKENMSEDIGNITADALLGFFLEEVGPLVYNRAVQDVQANLERRVQELDIDIHEDPFQYWPKYDRLRKRK
ncbi:MAG TPA: DUF2164 domain-containing protein [Noviherbaspirillum sp.]